MSPDFAGEINLYSKIPKQNIDVMSELIVSVAKNIFFIGLFLNVQTLPSGSVC